MKTRSATLPDFTRPPVIEVVLGIQFDRITGFQTIHAGHLWDDFRRDFPQVQEHPPLDPTFETFGTKPVGSGVKLELMSGPLPLPRLWFLNEAQTQLIQFQPDRFIHNWRKVQEDDVYPRYENIKVRFLDELNTLERFFHEHGLGELRPNQCEVTYVNHILSAAGENLCERPERVFRFFRKDFSQGVLDKFEDSRFQIRFVLSDKGKRPIGRLHVNVQPARSREGEPMIVLTLTARGSPLNPTLESASQFLDFGRDKIVRGFAELTTETMHERWARRQ